jgi:hypothetical protein
MLDDMPSMQSRRRTGRRYVILLFLVLALIGGWIWFWQYAAEEAHAAMEGWRAREAKAGRIYDCGAQRFGGFPFRFEVSCDRASAVFQSNEPPVEIKAKSVLVAAQVYQPNLIISEFHGPLTIADLGKAPKIVANWKLGQSSVSGTPKAPERVSLVFDQPAIDLVNGDTTSTLLRAGHIELHGRIAEGSVTDNPVIEIALLMDQCAAPILHPAAAQPVDLRINGVLRGLGDFAPKPWHERFRELQQRGGRIDITQVRIKQGETLAVGSGSLSIDPSGQLDGRVNVTVAGLEPFLIAIGAPEVVRKSRTVDKMAGMLDRLSPGLGNVAREQAGANLSAGIAMLGQPGTLEGRQAVTLPLVFKDGVVYLGPIPLGPTPALF